MADNDNNLQGIAFTKDAQAFQLSPMARAQMNALGGDEDEDEYGDNKQLQTSGQDGAGFTDDPKQPGVGNDKQAQMPDIQSSRQLIGKEKSYLAMNQYDPQAASQYLSQNKDLQNFQNSMQQAYANDGGKGDVNQKLQDLYNKNPQEVTNKLDSLPNKLQSVYQTGPLNKQPEDRNIDRGLGTENMERYTQKHGIMMDPRFSPKDRSDIRIKRPDADKDHHDSLNNSPGSVKVTSGRDPQSRQGKESGVAPTTEQKQDQKIGHVVRGIGISAIPVYGLAALMSGHGDAVKGNQKIKQGVKDGVDKVKGMGKTVHDHVAAGVHGFKYGSTKMASAQSGTKHHGKGMQKTNSQGRSLGGTYSKFSDNIQQADAQSQKMLENSFAKNGIGKDGNAKSEALQA